MDIKSDDELDALVAYVLGKEWAENTGEVKLLGDSVHGSMLLPCKNPLFEQAQEDFNNTVKTT